MADIIIDLAGKSGLADGHAGDKDMVTPQPNIRLATAENQMVGGFYNSYLREGYLSPAVDTAVPVTTDVAPASEFTSVEHDNVGGKVYWGDNTRSIYVGSDLNDTSLTEGLVLEATNVLTYPGRAYDELYDLQMYQVNGVRRLFYVGQGLTYGPTAPELQIGTQTSALSYGLMHMGIIPFGDTKPAVVNTNSQYLPSANESVGFTVTPQTNGALFALVISTDSGDFAGATYRDVSTSPSYPMTVAGSGSGGGYFWQLYKLANPLPVTTGEVRFNVNSAMSRIAFVFQTNNTDQTNMLVSEFNPDSTTNLIAQLDVVNKNQLDLVAGYLDNGTLATPKLVTVEEVYEDTTNTYGSHFLYELSNNIYGLQVGIATTVPTIINENSPNWLHQEVTAGFIHELPNNYAFMRIADNGFAYVYAGHRVHKIDGSIFGGVNGTATKDVLLFPEYFQITDAIDYRSRSYIVVQQYPVNVQDTSLNNYLGRCGVYVWNRISTQLSTADYIEIPGVREIKKIYASPDGVLKLICIGDNGITELRQFGYNDSGGVVFPVVRELGIGAYPAYPDGCTVAGDRTMWVANNGNVYCEKENAVTKVHQLKVPGTTSTGLAENIAAGAILYGSGTETADAGYRSNKQGMFMSYNDGTIGTEKIYPFDLTTGSNAAQYPNQGDVYTAVNLIPTDSNLKNLRIYNIPVTLTDETVLATVKVYFNQSTSAVFPDGITKTITAKEASKGYVDLKINKQYAHAVQIEVEWATAVPLGENTYFPSVAVLSNDATSTSASDSE